MSAPDMPVARPSRSLIVGSAAAVLVIAAAGYSWTGSPGLATGEVPTAQAGASPHDGAVEMQQFAAAVDSLAKKLETQPDNLEGWTMLARSYLQLGRLDEALAAFQRAIALDARSAKLLVDYADALAVKNGRSLDGEPMKLIERALAIEPNNLKGLALAGTAAFNRQDYAGAVRWWERLAVAAPPDSPWKEQVQVSIAEARQRGGLAAVPGAMPSAGAKPALPPQAAAQAQAQAQTPAAPQAQPAAANTTLRGNVRLAPALAAQAAPGDTVFIFARPAEGGSRMPLAILRRQVKDLPIDFALDDAMAMSPAMRLSNFPRVVIEARISKSGQAQATAGDLIGRTPPVAHDATGLVVEIAEVVR